jgi:hypothetical protein
MKDVAEIIESKNGSLLNEACLDVQNIPGYADKVLEYMKKYSLESILTKQTFMKKLFLLSLVHAENLYIVKDNYKLLMKHVPEYVLKSISSKSGIEFKDGEIEDEEIKDKEVKDEKVKDKEVKDEKVKDKEVKDEKFKDKEIKFKNTMELLNVQRVNHCTQNALDKLLFQRLFVAGNEDPLEIIFHMKDFERFLKFVEKQPIFDIEIFLNNLLNDQKMKNDHVYLMKIAKVPCVLRKLVSNERFLQWESPFAYPACISMKLFEQFLHTGKGSNALLVQAQLRPEIVPFFVHILLDNIDKPSCLDLLCKIGHKEIGNQLYFRFKHLDGYEGKGLQDYKERIPKKNESKWDVQTLILFKKYLRVMKMFHRDSFSPLKDSVFPSVLASLIGMWNSAAYDRQFTRDFLTLLVRNEYADLVNVLSNVAHLLTFVFDYLISKDSLALKENVLFLLRMEICTVGSALYILHRDL